MRRLFAAFVLASTVSLSAMIPSASAQIPGFQSFGFTGNQPFFSTGLNAGLVQCQAGGQINPTTGNVTPFFQATAIAPVPGPGPCVPPIGFGLGGLQGCVAANGIGQNNIGQLSAQAVPNGTANTALTGLAGLGCNLGGLNGALPGLGLAGGFNLGGLNGALPGLGLGGTGFFGGIGGLSTVGINGAVNGIGTVNNGIAGLNCVPAGPVIICQ
ncbi:MAG TPA: hypothetical protein VFE37_23275 [Chloroflexota bacterium]|nr:hypothetical protein [Chloroflexota bacterium]